MIIQTSSVSKKVSTSSGELTILHGINLSIQPGESVAVVGASGSGKSTLLSLLAGLDTATSGQVIVDNINIGDLDEEQRARLRAEKIGIIFQSFLLIPSLTALENVMLPAELNGRKDAEKRARELLTLVGLNERLQHYPNQLSGGEQQRVAIARAFIGEPAILFADEPTGNLDSTTGSNVEAQLFELNKQLNTTLVVITHDARLAARCDRVFEMDAGKLKERA